MLTATRERSKNSRLKMLLMVLVLLVPVFIALQTALWALRTLS